MGKENLLNLSKYLISTYKQEFKEILKRKNNEEKDYDYLKKFELMDPKLFKGKKKQKNYLILFEIVISMVIQKKINFMIQSKLLLLIIR